MASLHFWHARPEGRLFGDREVTLLRVLFPAFNAGVEAQLRWGRQRQDLLGTLDQLGNAALVCDTNGVLFHVTPSLESLFRADPEAGLLQAELHGVVREVCRSARGACFGNGNAPAHLVRPVRTQSARYQVSGCLYGVETYGRGYVVVNLERLTPSRRTAEELREEYSLTRAEAQVAMLLGDGRSNMEVAKALYISPHTARRHTERILQKMGLRSRSEVASKLYR